MGKERQYPYAASVFIGRFQPFHKGHLNSVVFALKHSKKLIIVLGSYRASPSLRAPWSAEERIEMIKSCLSISQIKRIYFVKVRDRLYCEELWIHNLKGEISKVTENREPVAIIGHEKDSSSYYLRIFPQWKFLETGNFNGIHATDIRKQFFLSPHFKSLDEKIPQGVEKWLKKYRKSSFFNQLKVKFLYADKFLKNKKNILPTQVCNSILYCSGYILFVKSKDPLKKGLYSLPEAKPIQNEEHKKCSIRGLLEETNISIPIKKIEASFQKERIFNYPERFPLCKQISQTYFYQLNETFLPNLFPGKNIESVEWILLDDVYLLEQQIYSDHFQMVQWFLGYKAIV